MSVKLSSPCNSSNFPSSLSSRDNMYCQLHQCMASTMGSSSILVYCVANVLFLLPLNIYVLYLGWQRSQRQSSSATMSHSDLFTYHMSVMELLGILGSILFTCGIHTNIPLMEEVGFLIINVTTPGQMFFHTLTCVERYLAVVHPIMYLGLRKTNGVRIRNISISCVWLLAVVWMQLMNLSPNSYAFICLCVSGLLFIVISFCCFSVLYILNRPGPADRVGGRQHIDQSRLRALYTIEAIMAVLLLRFGGNVLAAALYPTALLREAEICALLVGVFWCCLPSGLVLPLLSLHRGGKLPCCQRNSESGRGSD